MTSTDRAAALGQRLRERVRRDVVPGLATAIARRMAPGGALTDDVLDAAFRRTLVVVVRLLFVAYAEARDLLPDPHRTARPLAARARELAAGPDPAYDPDATGWWEYLRAVWRAVDAGDLFAAGDGLAALSLADAELGPALRALLVDTGDGAARPVDFGCLPVRELGTVYEGLLGSALSVAPHDLAADRRPAAYRPAGPGDEVAVRAGEVYVHHASGARKSTGSYFTPPFAVEHLLDVALEPALTDHLARVAAALEAGDDATAARLFLDFRVADLAMGAGHFLVAAVDRIERRLSAFLAEHPIAAVDGELDRLAARVSAEVARSALLRRQVARHCVYGLDADAVAVELARLALWLHTSVPGLPASGLDHRLVAGDSLTGIGTLDEVVDVLDPQRGLGYAELLAAALGGARDGARPAAETARALMDAAVAVRLDGHRAPATPGDAVALGNDPGVRRRVAELRAAHLPYLFPEVFLRGERSGFDVLLGNPPWEKVQVDERAFWARYFPGLRGLPVADQLAARRRHERERPDLVARLDREVAANDRLRAALLAGGYPGLGSGHPDLHQAFAWRFWRLLRPGGVAGLVLPRSAIGSSGGAAWRADVFDHGCFTDVTMLHNTGGWVFPDVHQQDRVVLLAVTRGHSAGGTIRLRGPYESLAELTAGMREPGLLLDPRQARTWGSGDALPWLPSPASGPVFGKLAAQPRLGGSGRSSRFRPVQGDLNATAHRALWDFTGGGDLPVYRGGSFHLWNPDTGDRFATAHSGRVLPELRERRLRQARTRGSAFGELPPQVVADPDTLPCLHPRIVFADVTNQSNARTVVTALAPPRVVLTHKAPYLLRVAGTAADEAYLLGVLSSVPLDWWARRYVEKTLSFEILNGFPVPDPDPGDRRRARVAGIAGRLAAVDGRYAGWAAEAGVPVGSVTDEATRDDLLAELDALVCLLYGLTPDEVEHVFATFHRGWAYRPRLAGVLAHYEAWSERVAR